MTNDVVFKEYRSTVLEIFINGTVCGHLELDIGSGWVYYGYTPNGFFSQRVIYAIADKMRELNTKLFGEDPDKMDEINGNPKAVEIKPAIRKLDLDD